MIFNTRLYVYQPSGVIVVCVHEYRSRLSDSIAWKQSLSRNVGASALPPFLRPPLFALNFSVPYLAAHLKIASSHSYACTRLFGWCGLISSLTDKQSVKISPFSPN